jgi:response regulator RpfG family c-di-GMP phosphodiesterase
MIAEPTPRETTKTPLPAQPPTLLRRLLASHVLCDARWDALPGDQRDQLAGAADDNALLTGLLGCELLTPYQFGRIRAGEMNSLLLGNYRILDKIGCGGMGIVFRAEQHKLRQPVAIKALFVSAEHNRRALDRFFREVQAVTKLKHPNIVVALDAGEQPGAGPQGAPVPYLVMEYVEGTNLEDLIIRDGPLPIEQACLIAYQIADALTEAHGHDLVHRDIKPGNVIITANGTAKLLDFGVARLPFADDRLTKFGSQLGTIGYMAPEQVRNARDVDARADVFGLGASLFFMLTGRDAFDPPAGAAGALKPPAAREHRSEVSPALDAMLQRLMALATADRVPSAEAAMRELLPFLGALAEGKKRAAPTDSSLHIALSAATLAESARETSHQTHRILVVDDQPDIRRVCKIALTQDGAKVDEAGTGPEAVDRIDMHDYDLILLDVDLPGLTGEQVLKKLRQMPRGPFQKVIMFSGRTSGDDLSRLLLAGADDYLTKPFSIVQLRARVKAALKLKDAQHRSEVLNDHLLTLNAELEKNVSHRDSELIHARGAMVLALAKLVERRSAETGPHLIRLQKYCRSLAETASRTPGFARRIDEIFIQALEDCAPLHDIGKVAVPDHILNKPGRLTDEERRLMEQHTVAGSETLREVARRYRFATGFLQMATDIARSHHERWDGSGYPDQLSGEAIPLAARLVAICDVYDALRSKRVYKPALSHNMAVMTMCEGSPGHFDPGLLAIFRQCGPQFERINGENSD